MAISRRKLLKFSSAAAVSSSIATNSFAGLHADSISGEVLLEQATKFILSAYPESASSAGIDKGINKKFKSQLTDRSIEGQLHIKKNILKLQKKLKNVSLRNVSSETQLNLKVVKSVFDLAVKGFEFSFGDVAVLNPNWSYRNSPYIVSQNTGSYVEIPSFLESSHSIQTAQDSEQYIERMKSYAHQLNGETERVRQTNVTLPNFLMQKTIAQLQQQRNSNIADWTIIKNLASKADKKYLSDAILVANENIKPALENQIKAHIAKNSLTTSDAGVWAKKDGDAYYSWALKAGTTTDMTPDEVHEMGLEELKALHSKMDPILKSVGYSQGSVGDRMLALSRDDRYLFKKGDPGRLEIMSFIDDVIKDIRNRMPQAFNTLVPGFLEVTRIAPEIEAGAPGAYGGAGSIDGTQPGHFWINLRSTNLHNKFNLADLTYHEAIPGHVWQGEYTFKQPLIRSLLAFNAYSEGWALYAQQIADELGVYNEFPAGRLGYLQSLAFRACRLVVDTGLHAKRWTREEAINWFIQNNGSSYDEVQSEVDRYCAWPGQACGYKVGHSAINKLRENAKLKLGTNFDFKSFNDTLVLGGNVPMTVLKNEINSYINKQVSKI